MFDEVYADLLEAGVEGTSTISGTDDKGRKYGIKPHAMPVGDISDPQTWLDAAAGGCRITGTADVNGRKAKVGFKDVGKAHAAGAVGKLLGIASGKPKRAGRGSKPDTMTPSGEPVLNGTHAE